MGLFLGSRYASGMLELESRELLCLAGTVFGRIHLWRPSRGPQVLLTLADNLV